ncbi:hypothetical protein F5X99DRAFT_408055 [Biscogniauxia marginata]|nr:hypothetical protein F5X99DRAFT_408055 [Biscogniauxia marginata]
MAAAVAVPYRPTPVAAPALSLGPDPAGGPIPGASEAAAAPIVPEHEKLLEAYRKFITTGPNAVDTTEAEVRAAFQAEISQPQGQLVITALTESGAISHRSWKGSAPMNGTIDITALLAKFHLDAFTIGRSVDGKAAGVYLSKPGVHLNGTLHYDDLTKLEGKQSIAMGFEGTGKFFIDFRNSSGLSAPVARFTSYPGFYFNVKYGSAEWTAV